MEERGIIIADRDADYRSQLADYFTEAGYRVETTDSAVRVLCSVLEKQTPVLLLGSDFDQKVSSVDLIHLLKKCNRHLHVIMVSEEMPLPLARKVREAGIFYHALKPAGGDDTEELGLAVECAFQKHASGGGTHHEETTHREPEHRENGPAEIEPVKRPMRGVLSRLAGLTALVFGISYLSLVTAESAKQGNSTAIWLFLSFCALIIATQLLPIFRIDPPVRASGREPAQQQDASSGKK